MHKHTSMSAVMAVLYSRNPDSVLLIKDRNEEAWWKFIGEGMEEGEFPIHTLIRGLWEEGGYICHPYDSEIEIGEVRSAKQILGKRNHIQYFYKVRLPYPRLRDLSGKKFPGKDADEFFETKLFSFQQVETMPDFFKPHLPLYKEFLGYTV